MEIPSLATVENEFRQVGGRLNLRQDGTIAFPHGHRFLQDAARSRSRSAGARASAAWISTTTSAASGSSASRATS
jgi:hypothetical protein